MLWQKVSDYFQPLLRLISLLVILAILLSVYNNLLFAQDTASYSVEQIDVNGTTEYRFKFDSHHFMTLIDDNGTFNLRPHPGCDVNGWGSSWYAQPFLPGAVLSYTVVNPIPEPNPTGIHVIAFGKVSRGSSSSYGTWGSVYDFGYDPMNKTITGTGVYTIALNTIALNGELDYTTGDLNLFKIASNYLDDVPLLTGGVGDTGDMEAADVTGDNFNFIWIPPDQPSHFPGDATDALSIDVLGKFNNVDTAAMGYEPIAPAFKPSLEVILISQEPDVGITFGGIYTLAYSQTFWADNVGVTPLIKKSSTETVFQFDVEFQSKALERCNYLPLIAK